MLLFLKQVDIEAVMKGYFPMIQKTIESFLPRQINEEWIRKLLGAPSFENHPDTLTEAISKPIYEILDRGGKRWRSVLVLLIGEVMGKTAESVADFIIISEIIHNGTLVIDDIEDKSDMRRGKPCLHLVYPPDIAINAGNGKQWKWK
jgi:geranylgeranyl pyrophosphate synthase